MNALLNIFYSKFNLSSGVIMICTWILGLRLTVFRQRQQQFRIVAFKCHSFQYLTVVGVTLG